MADNFEIEIVEQIIELETSEQVIEIETNGASAWDSIADKPTPGAENSFIISNSALKWVVKTLSQLKIILGLGSAAYTNSTAYAASNHSHNQTAIAADPFQTPIFANPLNLDATTHKDFKCGTITGNTIINLNNVLDGDAGMIEVIIDNVGGYNVALGNMFTKRLGEISLSMAVAADNFISYRKVGVDIIYTINQIG